MTETLRAAVIGAGMMGQHHVRVYQEMPEIDLLGFADADAKMRGVIEQRHHVRGYDDYRAMLDALRPDLVTIAVPTAMHCAVAWEAINRGIHVLIEKPIAESQDDARRMIDHARSKGVVLAVGHIERHNPAIKALKQELDEGRLARLFEIHAERVGPFPARIRDVGVVFDLATHDIDVMRYLAGSAVSRVYAETQQNIHSTREDTVSGLLRFENGVTGVLQVNWLTPTKSRRLRVTGAGGMFEVDYITQDLTFYENSELTDHFPNLQLLRGITEGRVIREKIEKREPLRLEIEDFVNAVRDRRPPLVTGEDSLKALRIATALVQAGQQHCVVELNG